MAAPTDAITVQGTTLAHAQNGSVEMVKGMEMAAHWTQTGSSTS